jgi:hypothetical protein
MSPVDIGEAIETAKNVKESAIARAARAGSQAHEGATLAWGEILGLGKRVADTIHLMRELGPDDVLGVVGLQRRRGVAPIIGSFTAGDVVGAGLGILFAPKSGAEMRALITKTTRESFSTTTGKVADAAKTVAEGTMAATGNDIHAS